MHSFSLYCFVKKEITPRGDGNYLSACSNGVRSISRKKRDNPERGRKLADGSNPYICTTEKSKKRDNPERERKLLCACLSHRIPKSGKKRDNPERGRKLETLVLFDQIIFSGRVKKEITPRGDGN